MTIIAGFRCVNGVVIASDSQITVGAILKLLGGSKIAYSKADEYSLLIGGAGHIDFIESLWEQILVDLDRLQDKSFHEIKELVSRNLLIFYDRHIHPTHPSLELGFQLLIALWTKDGRWEFFKNSDSALLDCSSVEAHGSGMLIGKYIAAKMAEQRFLGITVDQAEAIAVHVIKQAKKVDPYCGGETRIRILHSDGRIQESGSAWIEKIERFFEESERPFSWGLSDIASGRIRGDTIDHWLRDISEIIKKLQQGLPQRT